MLNSETWAGRRKKTATVSVENCTKTKRIHFLDLFCVCVFLFFFPETDRSVFSAVCEELTGEGYVCWETSIGATGVTYHPDPGNDSSVPRDLFHSWHWLVLSRTKSKTTFSMSDFYCKDLASRHSMDWYWNAAGFILLFSVFVCACVSQCVMCVCYNVQNIGIQLWLLAFLRSS
jgi:hypothetical protein